MWLAPVTREWLVKPVKIVPVVVGQTICGIGSMSVVAESVSARILRNVLNICMTNSYRPPKAAGSSSMPHSKNFQLCAVK